MKTSSSQTAMTERLRGLAAKARGDLRGLARAGPLALILNLTPVPASRPRVTKWGSFYGKNYENFRKEAATALTQALADLQHLQIPRHTPVAVVLELILQRPKTGKLAIPMGDADNFAKAVLDAVTTCGGVWADDYQVAHLAVTKRYAVANEDEGIRIDVCPIEEST